MLCYAILLDGGFLKRKLGSARKPASADDIVAFTRAIRTLPELAHHRLHRILYYDAVPSTEAVQTPFGGPRVELGASESHSHNTNLHAQLARQDYFALRLGELAVRGWKPKPRLLNLKGSSLELTQDNIALDIQQKGVDMRIGLDIAALTLKKITQVIVLVTADSDFIPAMKFARREGAQLMLVTLGNPISQRMFDHADWVVAREFASPGMRIQEPPVSYSARIA
jgi:uncharacterized LabA/DUF88 family protein